MIFEPATFLLFSDCFMLNTRFIAVIECFYEWPNFRMTKLIDLNLRLRICEEKSKKTLFNKLLPSEIREIKQQHKTPKKILINDQENWLSFGLRLITVSLEISGIKKLFLLKQKIEAYLNILRCEMLNRDLPKSLKHYYVNQFWRTVFLLIIPLAFAQVIMWTFCNFNVI